MVNHNNYVGGQNVTRVIMVTISYHMKISTLYTFETNIILYINYISIKKCLVEKKFFLEILEF